MNNYRYKDGLTKANLLLWFMAVLLVLNALLRPVYNFDRINLLYVLKIISYFLYFRFFFNTLKSINYSFWTLLLILGVYVLNDLVSMLQIDNGEIFASIDVFIVFMGSLLAYIMYSPLYFPRVQWWEYDFRFRGDLKITAECKGMDVAGRLSDLRRGAGCIILFEDLSLGEVFKIKTFFGDDEVMFDCMVISKREISPGRGLTYGVKFLLLNKKERKFFSTFCENWNMNKQVKVREKFLENRD